MTTTEVAGPRPWGRAIAWLAVLAPFFYLTYGWANAMAARRAVVGSIVFSWERHVPFVAWTIVPYWSINAFYGASVFVCATKAELDVHVRRLLTAQVLAVACFVLFPLRFTFLRQETHGFAGLLFTALASFDRPFNQAPSLHIALLAILWHLYAAHTPRLAIWPLHLWFPLVGASVLTTYQHHFIDVPTGALLGIFCLWLWPDGTRSPLATAAIAADRRRLIIALRYAIGACLFAGAGFWIGGAGWWLLWPAVSLTIVAASYAALGPNGFQKDARGRMSLTARLLLAPYLAAAFVNSRLWTRREPKPSAIGRGIWLGRIPSTREAGGFAAVVDVCAELPRASTSARWTCIPTLDLVTPSSAQLRDAAAAIERERSTGSVLVCCALGYSRSAASVATWLLTTDAALTMDDALAQVRRARPRIVIDANLRAAIAAAANRTA